MKDGLVERKRYLKEIEWEDGRKRIGSARWSGLNS